MIFNVFTVVDEFVESSPAVKLGGIGALSYFILPSFLSRLASSFMKLFGIVVFGKGTIHASLANGGLAALLQYIAAYCALIAALLSLVIMI